MSQMGPDCVKTLTSNLRVEILSRLRRIGKEQHWQSQSKEEKGENNSAHSLLARVFTQPGPKADAIARIFQPRHSRSIWWQVFAAQSGAYIEVLTECGSAGREPSDTSSGPLRPARSGDRTHRATDGHLGSAARHCELAARLAAHLRRHPRQRHTPLSSRLRRLTSLRSERPSFCGGARGPPFG